MKIMLDNVRFSYFNGITPTAFEDGGDKSYSMTSLFPKTDKENLAKIQSAIKAVANDKWKDKAGNVLAKLKQQGRMCLSNGDDKLNNDGEITPGYEGMWVVSCSQRDLTAAPKIFHKSGVLVTSENIASFDGGVPYSGCYGKTLIEVWAQDNKYGQRVNAIVLAAAFKEDGEAFGVGAVSEDAAREGLGLGSADPVGDLAEESLDDLFDGS